MSLLTSHASPLAIATVSCPNEGGIVGMTICPRKHQADAHGAPYLLQVTQLISQVLPIPKEDAAPRL